MSSDVNYYLGLVTSKHNQRPKYMAMLLATFQPLADLQGVLAGMPALFDLDTAGGSQEDVDGQWIGVSRNVSQPITGVYFSLDDATLGLDQGSLQGPFDPNTGLIALPDETYRLLLRAKILNDRWDGTVPGAYSNWAELFGTSFTLLIQDEGNMTMLFALFGPLPDPITLALFSGGYINTRPAGVQVEDRLTPGVANTPYFGLDLQSSVVAGLDTGSFGISAITGQ